MPASSFRDEVRLIVSPHKFGGSRRAAAAYLVSLDGGCDEETGSVEWSQWIGRIGRTLVAEDDLGFVDAVRYRTEDEARAKFALVEEAYGKWLDEGEES